MEGMREEGNFGKKKPIQLEERERGTGIGCKVLSNSIFGISAGTYLVMLV